MTIAGVVAAASWVLGTLLALCLTVSVAARVVRHARARRRERAEDAVRPLVLALLDDPTAVVALPSHGGAGRAVRGIVTALLPQLRGADRDVLAGVLARHGQVERARHDLGSRRPRRRAAAVELLGATGAADTDVLVADLVRDRDRQVRVTAVRALGRMATPVAAASIVTTLRDHLVPANTATMALLRCGPAAAQPLLAALGEPPPAERTTVVELLGVLGVAEARAAIEEVVVDARSAAERAAAVRALGRIGDPASTPLVLDVLTTALDGPHADVELSIACVEALGLLGDRRAIPALTGALGRSHRLSFAAAEALAPMGPRRSRRSMRERAGATAPVAAILGGLAPDGGAP